MKFSIVFLILSLTIGCLTRTSQTVQPPTEVACGTPVVVLVLVDQTKSMRSTSTATPAVEDFDSLINKLAVCGGELKVAFVRDRPETGDPRLRFPEPAPMPDKPVQAAEEEDYEFGDRMADYGRQLLERQDDIADMRTKIEPAIQAFRSALRERLSRPLADHTDFNSPLNDAEIFLNSSAGRTPNQPERYLIINSDALDEKRRRRLNIKSGATVFWINTATDDKALSGYQFTRFSDFATAVRRITDK